MWGFSKLVMQAVVVLAVAALAHILISKAAIPGADGIAAGIAAAAGGLVLGLVMAWFGGIRWQLVPLRIHLWSRRFVRHCGWASVGIASIAVLIYY